MMLNTNYPDWLLRLAVFVASIVIVVGFGFGNRAAAADLSRLPGSSELQTAINLPAVLPLVGPTLNISTPSNGAVLFGLNFPVNYTTSGDITTAQEVHFILDGGPVQVDSSLDGEFLLTNLAIGTHSLDGYLARQDQTKIEGSDATTTRFEVSALDTVRPTVVMINPRNGDTLSANVTLSAIATDDLSLAGVQFKLDGKALGPEDTTAPYNFDWNTQETTNGIHVLTAVARDGANNVAESRIVNIIVYNAPMPPPGLIAAYGFDEGEGAIAADASGYDNDGTVTGAAWVARGYLGGALSFNGFDNLVTVADSDSLDLTTGMTLSAWVNPAKLGSWRTAVLKEIDGDLAYSLYAGDDKSKPAGYGRFRSNSISVKGASKIPLNTWTHLAVTYDGSYLRLFVNGSQVRYRATKGQLTTSSLPLRIGGNTIWGEYFSGLIDEVRIYNRALEAAEIQAMMKLPITPLAPTRSSPIALDSYGRLLWVVNPDNDSVSAIDADTLSLLFEVPVGKHPTSIAVDRNGQVWVTCRDDDSVWMLGADGSVRNVFKLPWGAAPISVILTPDSTQGFVGLYGSGQIQKFDPITQALGKTLTLGTTPRAMAITADGKRLLVSQFISTDVSGKVRTVELDSFAEGQTFTLPLDSASSDGSIAARGLPNYLAGLAIDPSGGLAWAVGKKDNILRGRFRDGKSLTFETTVRALLSPLDLNVNQEITARRVDLDNLSQPSAITLNETGTRLFVTLQGNNKLVVLNQLGREITRAETGLAPQGIVIDYATGRIFTQDFMSRTVSVFDGTALLKQTGTSIPRLAQIRTIGTEKLPLAVLRGKQIFYNAADTRMSRDGYLSCAVCHLDGEHDGQVWDFTDRGEGLRNTTSLRGQGGHDTAPFHWTGNFDEAQDFENDIRAAFGGLGFMNDVDFSAGTRSQPLGDPKTGISLELDDLSAYLDSLVASGRSPRRDGSGALTNSAQVGSVLFENLGCQTCHGSDRFTDLVPGSRHDVGTLKTASGQRLGTPLDGLDTPTLIGLWVTAPYLHDGSAKSIKEVLTTANPDGRHGNVSSLSQGQIDQLADYLLQLEYAPQ